MTFRRMDELDLAGKRLLIREDLNVPIADGAVANDARIAAALPTLKAALGQGARVVLLSHLGRPREGEFDPAFSLSPVAERLSEMLGEAVPLLRDLQAAETTDARIALLENVRFLEGEKANDESLSRRLAGLADIFVMDAFATAHRAQASTHGVARFACLACAGPLLANELDALGRALDNPRRPLLAIVGGSKVSTKLSVLDKLASLADGVIVGGGIANTFIAAAGYTTGRSLVEANLLDVAAGLADRARIPLPVDVMVGKRIDENETAIVRALDQVAADEMILDIGPETARRWKALLADAGTILWNGPVGVFEYDQFGEGTRVLAEGVAESGAFSVAGGGDTLAAIDKYGVRDGISYISTGGGAFLEFVEGKTLPAVAVLQDRLRN
ncbi:MAG: phosphoglycerate kinase [Gammaproteobacteria bacterium]|nr:phosphoglycerate kinase [Gammaproteobacteria bacterium]